MLLASELSRDDTLLIFADSRRRCWFADDIVRMRWTGFAASAFSSSTAHGESSIGENISAPWRDLCRRTCEPTERFETDNQIALRRRIVARHSASSIAFAGHISNVPIQSDFKHVNHVLHECFITAPQSTPSTLIPNARGNMTPVRLILGSRSPRRRELLSLLVAPEQIEVRPPLNSDELSFDGLTTWLEIAQRLQLIARVKNDDVCQQLSQDTLINRDVSCLVLTADTTIVATDAMAHFHVLGQPPEDVTWPDIVRGWFRDLYAGRSHIAATALCLTEWPTGRRLERIVQSHVLFRDDVETLLDWYIATGEPRGKAGGYALQGLASVFVTRVEGSITNVVGLPLEALIELLAPSGLVTPSL